MSFKLIDKIKKSNMPGSLKKVFEGYVSFGNADGTNIRPTERHVARRASCSRSTVTRHTPELVKWGFLIHELNEDGTYKTCAYPKDGVWAYVYRATLAPLENPQVVAIFEFERQELSRKRAAAGAKGGRPKRQLGLFDESNLLQTPRLQIATNSLSQIDANPPKQFATQTIPSSPLRSEELRTTPTSDPSAVSTAELKKEKEPLATSSLAEVFAAEVNSQVKISTASNPSGLEPEDKDNTNTEDQTVEDAWDSVPSHLKVAWAGEEAISAVGKAWVESTGLADGDQHPELVAEVIWHSANAGVNDPAAAVRAALRDCPKTAGVRWLDFPFFAKQWKDVTLPNLLAWQRKHEAKLRENAELSRHGACTECEMRPAMDVKHKLCNECYVEQLRAEKLIDLANKTGGVRWSVKDDDMMWIGTQDKGSFYYKRGESHTKKVRRLAKLKDSMDAIETLLDEKLGDELAPVGKGFNAGEAD